MNGKNNISQYQKNLILTEVSTSGCSILSIAKKHNISKSAIYKWLREIKGQNESFSSNGASFVELKVVNHSASSNKPALSLQKASLVFSGFSISVEGPLPSTVILKILNAIEESLC